MDFTKNALDTAGDNDKSENHENVILGEFYEIKLGIQVSSEEAYILYSEYALNKGFSIWKGITRKADGVITYQAMRMCLRQGYKEFEDPFDSKKYNKLDTKTGCARILKSIITFL